MKLTSLGTQSENNAQVVHPSGRHLNNASDLFPVADWVYSQICQYWKDQSASWYYHNLKENTSVLIAVNFFSQETSEYMVLNDEMELEMDELNQHECMAPLTTLIKHMQRNQITPKVEEASMNQKFGIVSLVITKQQSCVWLNSFILYFSCLYLCGSSRGVFWLW